MNQVRVVSDSLVQSVSPASDPYLELVIKHGNIINILLPDDASRKRYAWQPIGMTYGAPFSGTPEHNSGGQTRFWCEKLAQMGQEVRDRFPLRQATRGAEFMGRRRSGTRSQFADHS